MTYHTVNLFRIWKQALKMEQPEFNYMTGDKNFEMINCIFQPKWSTLPQIYQAFVTARLPALVDASVEMLTLIAPNYANATKAVKYG